MKKLLLGLVCSALAFPVFAQDLAFNILTQDEAVVTAVRSEGDNVWIKLASNHLTDTITVRISNQNRDVYRAWFNGQLDLVSAGFRGNDVWSDRVQTKASYIEFWHNDVLVLHLERK